MEYGLKNALRAARWIRKNAPGSFQFRRALVLGSGLGGLIDSVRVLRKVPYEKIPGFSRSAVPGHEGKLIFARGSGGDILIFSGRSHLYEGLPPARVVFPLRVMASLGMETVVLTSAVGSMNPKFRPGDIVVLKDHVNFMGSNPLAGRHEPGFGERFPDMSACYDSGLRQRVLKSARRMGVRAFPGCYWAVTGPSYETPSEIKVFRRLGGDVVGMSMVPETAAARQAGLRVLGLSYVANMASGMENRPLSHADVLAAGEKASKNLGKILNRAIPFLAGREKAG